MSVFTSQVAGLQALANQLVDAVDTEAQEGMLDPLDVDSVAIEEAITALFDELAPSVYFGTETRGLVTSKAPQS